MRVGNLLGMVLVSGLVISLGNGCILSNYVVSEHSRIIILYFYKNKYYNIIRIKISILNMIY